MTSPGKRYSQCDDTCTTDCGHCKGNGPPPAETQQDCTEEMPCEVCADPEPELHRGDDCLGRYVPNEQDRKNWAALASRPSADAVTLQRVRELLTEWDAVAQRTGERRAQLIADRLRAALDER